jgi:hypothetical protein
MGQEELITSANVDLARRLAAWLQSVGVEDTSVAVDFADIVAAAKLVELTLQKMIVLDVARPDHADEALTEMGRLYAWLFDEMKHHLDVVQRSWPQLEGRLVALAPDNG